VVGVGFRWGGSTRLNLKYWLGFRGERRGAEGVALLCSCPLSESAVWIEMDPLSPVLGTDCELESQGFGFVCPHCRLRV
jgi:hypothetical protein